MNSRIGTVLLAIGFSFFTSSAHAGYVGVGQQINSTNQALQNPSAQVHPHTQVDQWVNSAKYDDAVSYLNLNYASAAPPLDVCDDLMVSLSSLIDSANRTGQTKVAKEAFGFAESLVDRLAIQDSLMGHGAVELSYPYMQSLSRIGHAGLELDKQIAAKLFLQSGAIARNLERNALFPRQALRGIAGNLVVEAKGHALLGRQTKAESAMRTAYEWGFVDFEFVLDDEVLADADHDGAIKRMTLDAKEKYQVAVKLRVQDAVNNFAAYQFEFSLTGAEGQLVQSSDFENELVVIDLGATWCAPCVKSIPHLKQLQKEFGDRGVRVLNASFENGGDTPENRELLKEFVRKHDIEYQVVFGSEQLKASIPQFQSYPALVFVDRRGQVRYVANGYHDYTQISSIVEVILGGAGM